MSDRVPAIVDPFQRLATRTRAVERVTEQRDPSAATQQLRWYPPGQAMVPEWNADEAVRFGYLANVVAYRCVQIIASDISALNFRAGLDPDRPDQHNPRARLAQLLGPPPGGPTPNLSARRLIAWTVAQKLVTGRYGWEIETTGTRGAGQVAALWPLVSANLEALPSDRGVDWFRAFEYGPRHDPVQLAKEQVFYGWTPHPTDFRQPLSPLLAARYDLSLAVMSDRYSLSFLANGALPAVVVTTEKFESEAARNRFQRGWHARYQGPDNAGKVAFHEVGEGDGKVGDAIDVKALGLSQKDARFVESHQQALSMVAIAIGVPWSRLDASGRTFDNASQEDVNYWTDTVLPIVRDLQDDINMQLAPRLGPEVGWFDLAPVRALQVKPDPLSAKVGVPSLVQARIWTIDEGRADYGLPPLPNGQGDRLMDFDEIALLRGGPDTGGDTAARSVLAMFEARASEVLGEIRAAAIPPGPPTPPAPTRTRPTEHRQLDPEALEQRRVRIWRRTDSALTVLEGRWERAFARLFGRQSDAVLRRLEGKRGRQAVERRDTPDAGGLFDPEFWRGETDDLARDLYDTVLSSAGGRLADQLGIDFDLAAEAVDDFISARANQLAGQVTDTTYAAIQDALQAGVAEGEGIPELAQRIREVFEQAGRNRSTVIARTEVVSAYNGATAMWGAELPPDVVAGQEWIATRDGRTRPAHAAADGQVIRTGEPFTVGGQALAYPGDPAGSPANTVQCRCALALLTPDELEAVTGAEPERARVSLRSARAVLGLIDPESFDETRLRRALEVAA